MLQALDIMKGPHANALYETLFFGEHVRFQYPPMSIIPITLLSKIGLSSIHALNAINFIVFILNAVAVGFLADLLFSSSTAPPKNSNAKIYSRRSMEIMLLATGVTFLFYPVIRAGVLGQIQLWIDCLFTFALVFWLKERRLAAGIVIGIACAIKPQLGLLVVWGLLWREWQFVKGILISLLPVVAVSLSLYGWHNHFAYLDVLSFLTKHGESYVANNSINGIFNWYFAPDDSLHWYDNEFTPYIREVYFGTIAASLVTLAIIFVPPLLHRRRANVLDLAVAAISTVVGSPVAWEHHYGILLPLYFLALKWALELGAGFARNVALGSIFVSWIFVADYIPFSLLFAHTEFRFVQAYCFFGALVLLAMLMIACYSKTGSGLAE